MWHKYLINVHLDTKLDYIFKVDSVSQHIQLSQAAQVGCHLAELGYVS